MTGLIKDENRIKIVLFSLTSSASLVSLLSLFGLYNITVGVFHNQNHYGYYLCMMLPLTLGMFISSDNKYRFIYLAEAILLSSGLIFCGSMGPFIAVVFSVVCFIIFTIVLFPQKILDLILAIFLSTVTGIVCTSVNWDLGTDFATLYTDASIFISKISGGTTTNVSDQEFNSIGSGRGILWKYAWQFACERPIFGYGPDCLSDRYYLLTGAVNQRPHNEFLQIAASLGFPALAFYLTGLFSLFIRFIQIFKKLTPLKLTLFICVLSYLISSFFGNTMYYTSPYFFMLLGFCFNLSKAPDSDSNTEVIK